MAARPVIRAFFEGPAGSGKTHLLIEEAVGATGEVFLAPEQKLLALTFMNGARQRLDARFGGVPQLRGRFICLTFDSFAGSLVQRRRSLLRSLPATPADELLNEFDRICIDAARLLEVPAVAAWMAAAYPLVVVDEAQDLDVHRFRMLQGISAASCVVAAADDFQNLNPRIDTHSVMEWLRAAERSVRLSRIQRTSQDGLLRVAGALREGRDVCAELRYQGGFHGCHSGDGIRVVESPARNAGALAWAVANELSQVGQQAVVLTPDATGERVRGVLARVQSLPPFNRNRNAGTTFGPYPLTWEQREEDETAALLAIVPDEDWLAVHEAISAFSRIGTGVGRYLCERLARIRSVRGEQTITRERLGQMISDVLRDTKRHRPPTAGGRSVMTIHRAKNREFTDVVVLWPHTVGGGMDQQRRLLYNAITRAQQRCSVVVFGQGRTRRAPFA